MTEILPSSYTGPPNITTSFETNIKKRSVKLTGNVYFFYDSPGIVETFWTKDNKKINTEEIGGKLSEISNTDNLSLVITNVSPDDAGEYKLTAINAVGSSSSDAIVLGILIKCSYISFLLYLSGISVITNDGAALFPNTVKKKKNLYLIIRILILIK